MSEQKTYTKKDYKSDLKPVWCPGCGDYGVLTALQTAFAELEIPPHKVVLISGIGCSSRLPGYCSTYGFNTIHGRAVPIACGVKAVRPDLTVVAVGGDGDMFSIGTGHFPHAARRNIDITLVAMDNNIYGLTKGQTSPTTPLGVRTATAVYAFWPEEPINPVKLAIGCAVSFVAQTHASDIKHMTRMIVEGIKWPGFAFIEVLSPCVTYRGREQYQIIREKAKPVPEDHDPTDAAKAIQLADDPQWHYMGIIYKNPRPTFEERFQKIREKARQVTDGKFESVLERFRT